MSGPTLLGIAQQERRFEDFAPGETYEHHAGMAVSEEDILDFAGKFDLQYLHTDPQAAAAGPFGGLVACGAHVVALMTRLLTEHYLPREAGLGGPGADDLRWLRPVRPGDKLRLKLHVADALPVPAQPDRGLIKLELELINQNDEAALTVSLYVYLRTRTPGGDS